MISRKISIISRDPQDSEDIETTIPFDISTEASYQTLDTGVRALNSLTDNSYVDAHITNILSLNEELAAAGQ